MVMARENFSKPQLSAFSLVVVNSAYILIKGRLKFDQARVTVRGKEDGVGGLGSVS